MATERFEAPLERLRVIEEFDTEPIKRTASGFVDYDYYLLRAKHQRAEAWRYMVRRGWSVVRRFLEYITTHAKRQDDISELTRVKPGAKRSSPATR